MKPLFALITDTHLDHSNIDLVKDIFNQTIDYCKSNDISTLIHAGDFFTSRNAQQLSVLLAANEIFESIDKNDLDLYIIPGNHDKVNLDSKSSYLEPFKHRFNLIDTTYILSLGGNFEKKIALIPYFKEDTYYNYLTSDEVNADILITHIAVNGVSNNDSKPVENNLTKNLFSKYQKVFVGHYHNRSNIDNIWYVGSSHSSNYGEDDNKGLTVVYEDYSHKQVKLKFPKYTQIKVKVSDLDSVLKTIKELSLDDNNKVRLVLQGSKEETIAINQSIFNDLHIEVKYEHEDKIANQLESDFKQYSNSDIVNLFNQYCKEYNIDEKEGIEILNQIL